MGEQDHDMDEVDNGSFDDEESIEIVTAPSLYIRPTYFRQTRKRGKILKTVTERYIREDLGLGCYYVDDSDPNRRAKEAVVGRPEVIEDASQLLNVLRPSPIASLVVCDANVLLHNLDVLEQSAEAMPNIVIPQTSLTECRSNQLTAYDRTVEMLRSVGENSRLVIFFADPHHVETAHVAETSNKTTDTESATMNDLNDMRIRSVAAFYGQQLHGSNTRVILLTDDAESRARARKEQGDDQVYEAWTVRSWVRELEKKDPKLSLSDLVAQYGTTSHSTAGHSAEQQRTMHFSPHVDAKKLSLGVKSGLYHRGVLRSSSNTDAWVTIRRGDERVAVTIQGWKSRNRAVDGDVVAVALNPVSEWMSSSTSTSKEKSNDTTVGIANETAEPTQSEMSNVPDSLSVDDEAVKSLRPTGKVVGLLRRNFSSYCGSIYAKSSSATKPTERDDIASSCELEHADGSITCVFFPVDTKVPPILIRTTQRERLLGQRILVAMDSWPAHSPYPMGHYVRTIGEAGTKDVETHVLLQQHNIPHEPFPAKVLACLPPADYKIDNDNSPGREDLRNLPVLSIDPPGCKDIDDALHCIVLPNGNYQVGVHIADVTHYVKAGTAIDLEAANRSTSTYLVNKRLDMLPGLLTTDLCSLKGNVDRYAFSVLWEVTPEADIVDVDFKKTIIHSIAALTYQQAQSLIDEPKDNGDIQVGAVKRLASLARKFRSRRIAAGALTLASPEVKFVLDSESLNPTDVQAYTLLEANALVEEFMLLANVTVSKKILRHYPTLSVLRRHPAPNRTMFDSLISKAKCRGFDIDIEDSKRLADSLDAAQIKSDPYFNKLLRILSTRCMSPAQYFCSGEYKPTDWHHYGLAAPVYTHFTSPIRRYADVCVHRLLAAAIGVAPLPVHLSSKSYLHDLAANMNRRHRSAQLAGRASVQLHTLIFFSGDDGAKEDDAYVLDVETAAASDPSFTVIVPRYGIEGRVKLTSIAADDPNIRRDAEQHRLSYKNQSIQVFDKVRVRIWVREVQDHQKELVLDLVEPKLGANHATISSEESSLSQHPLSQDDGQSSKSTSGKREREDDASNKKNDNVTESSSSNRKRVKTKKKGKK